MISEAQIQRPAQEAHQRRGLAEALRHLRAQLLRGHRRLAQRREADEVLALQVLRQRVVPGETARRVGERVAFQREVPAEVRLVARRDPGIAVLRDGLAYPEQRIRIGAPQPDGDETAARFYVQVIARRMDVFARLVAELDADVGVVYDAQHLPSIKE